MQWVDSKRSASYARRTVSDHRPRTIVFSNRKHDGELNLAEYLAETDLSPSLRRCLGRRFENPSANKTWGIYRAISMSMIMCITKVYEYQAIYIPPF